MRFVAERAPVSELGYQEMRTCAHEWPSNAHGSGGHGKKHDDWRNIERLTLQAPPEWCEEGVEGESLLAPF